MINNIILLFLNPAKICIACSSSNQSVTHWHANCNIQVKKAHKEETKMKTTIAKKTAYIGAGAGLVLFAIFGLLPGSLLGGAMGINIAGWLFGLPLHPGIVARVIVFVSMLVGVLVAGIVMVTATSSVGWLAGKVLESGVHREEQAGEAYATHK
jgi:pheromone shutdown protein TraB